MLIRLIVKECRVSALMCFIVLLSIKSFVVAKEGSLLTEQKLVKHRKRPNLSNEKLDEHKKLLNLSSNKLYEHRKLSNLTNKKISEHRKLTNLSDWLVVAANSQYQSSDGDPKGAFIYIIVVIFVYALPIIILVATYSLHQSQRSYIDKHESDRQVAEYIVASEAIREAYFRETLRELKQSLIPVLAKAETKLLANTKDSEDAAPESPARTNKLKLETNSNSSSDDLTLTLNPSAAMFQQEYKGEINTVDNNSDFKIWIPLHQL